MPIHAKVAQSCFYIFPIRSAVHSGDELEHFCSFCFYSQSSLLLHLSCLFILLSLFLPSYPLIYRNQNNTLQRMFTTGKWISSIIDGFHIVRSGSKVSRHHNGALVLHAQPVFDKTNHSNEKSERNRQPFLIYGRCWGWILYSTSMQIWFPLLPWLFRFI